MEKDIFESTEQINAPEPLEIDYFEVGETWETVEPNIRVKKVDGKVVRYEVKLDFGRKEVYSKKKKAWRHKMKNTESADSMGIFVALMI